jgi:hypothetical protein
MNDKPFTIIHSSEAIRPQPPTNLPKKLRSDSHWLRFTETERNEIRRIYEQQGVRFAEAYCREIGKTWAHAPLARFFHKERAAIAAEVAQLRIDLACSRELVEVFTAFKMDITEATAFELAKKLRQTIKISAANPETPEGRAILRKSAPHLIALRAMTLREQADKARLELKAKELELRREMFRFSAVEAIRQNADKVKEIIANSSNNDEKTEALGRLMFPDTWDLEDRNPEDRNPGEASGNSEAPNPQDDGEEKEGEDGKSGTEDGTGDREEQDNNVEPGA